MSSFGALGSFRVGYWTAVRRWVLRERRDVEKRINTINAELARIGKVTLEYRAVTNPTSGEVKRTEHREYISVTPGSSLEKLLQAYIVQGGNPLDISQFWIPARSSIVGLNADNTPVYAEEYPYGGVAAPVSHDYDETDQGMGQPQNDTSGFGPSPGGYLNLTKYAPKRTGGRKAYGDDHEAIARVMHHVRGWCNKEIREKLQNLEAKIIKLADLGEQLEKERDETLQQAFGGALSILIQFDDEIFAQDRRVQKMVADIDSALFAENPPDGPLVGVPNKENISLLGWTYADDPTELLLDLMP